MTEFNKLKSFLEWLSLNFNNGKASNNNVIKMWFYMNNRLHLRLIYSIDETYNKVYFYTEGFEWYLGLASTVDEAVDVLSGIVTEEVPNGSIREYCRMSNTNLEKVR